MTRLPPPLDEPARARVHLIVALGIFLGGTIVVAADHGAFGSLLFAIPLLGMGAFSILIFGTTRLLLAGMAGRDVGGPRLASWAILAAAIGGALGASAAAKLPLAWVEPLVALWGVAFVAHFAIVLSTVRAERIRPAIQPKPDPVVLVLATVLQTVALLYGIAAAYFLMTSYAQGGASPLAFHLLLVGFVLTTILGVALQILPRFTGVPAKRIPVALVTFGAAPGPAILAIGFSSLGGARWLLAGAAFEGFGVACFIVVAFAFLLRARRWRPSFVAYGVALVAIAVGGTLATVYAAGDASGSVVPLHATLNLFGFVGFFILGASIDLYAPAFSPGARAQTVHAGIVLGFAIVGLVLAVSGLAAFGTTVATVGFTLYAVALAVHLGGAIQSHIRIQRTRHRGTFASIRSA
ncbi:MAG: hypothetical protein ACYDDF_15155 [Thermoplasmatota archaeon]